MKNLITISKAAFFSAEKLKSYGLVIGGSLILAIGYGFFIVPHNIVPGGVFGLSIVIHNLIDLPVGMIALSINIPLLIWGTKILGRATGVKTAISMVSVSLFLDAITILTNGTPLIKDILVSSIFGGILIGLAVAIVMNAGATTGGNDIFARIIIKRIRLPFNQIMLATDAIIVLVGVINFGDFTMAAYCIIAVIAISQTVAYYLKKSVQNKTILVFSKKNTAIHQRLMQNTNIGANIIQLIHRDSNEKLILITKNNRKLEIIKDTIRLEDNEAHIIVLESNKMSDEQLAN